MKFKEMFNPIEKGDHGLTEEAVYSSIQGDGEFIPLWGGNAEHNSIERYVSSTARTKANKSITIFRGPGVIISLDGSAGSMTYKHGTDAFALNHHAGFFKLRDDVEVLSEYFALFLQNQMREESVSEGSKTLTLEQIYHMDFEIPSYDAQKETIVSISPILAKKRLLEQLLRKVSKIRGRALSEEYSKYQVRDVPISEILDCIGGNSGLTEEYLYSIICERTDRIFKVLTGSEKIDGTHRVHLCPHPKNPERRISTHCGEGIHVVRKGKAGKLTYLPPDYYTTNDDAYILTLKKSCEYQIDLGWLAYACQHLAVEYASSADNGTWNKTGFFRFAAIDIPSLNEQREAAREQGKLTDYERRTRSLIAKLEDLLRRKPVS